MHWYHWLMIAAGIYLAIGIAMMFMLQQTPYAENPILAMILLWPIYVLNM